MGKWEEEVRFGPDACIYGNSPLNSGATACCVPAVGASRGLRSDLSDSGSKLRQSEAAIIIPAGATL